LSGAEAFQELTAAGTTTEGYLAARYGYRLAKQAIPAGEAVSRRYPVLDALYRILYEDAPAVESLWGAIRTPSGPARAA
jgi:hypothetical protein